MKIFWLINIALPEACRLMNESLSPFGGWLVNTSVYLSAEENINLAIAFPKGGINDIRLLKAEKIDYYAFPPLSKRGIGRDRAILPIFYYLFKNKKIVPLLIVLLVVFILCMYHLPLGSGTLYGLKTRVVFSITDTINRDFASLTSNRSSLNSYYISYFFTQGMGVMLFGGRNIIAGIERQNMLNMFGLVSHNSYIDMLFAVGVIGTAFILVCFIYEIIKNIISYINSKHEYYLAFAFLKLTILWFSAGASIFPFRYFLTYMML